MSRRPKDEVYTVYQQHFDNMVEGFKALRSQCKTLKRLIKQYPGCVFVMGLSEHDDKYAKKINLNQGKPGHPRVGHVPKSERYKNLYKEGVHLHIYIGGLYAATVATEFVDIQNKNYHKRYRDRVEHYAVICAKTKDGQFPLDYVLRQSTNWRFSDKKAVREYADKRNAEVKKKSPPYRGKRSVYARTVREF